MAAGTGNGNSTDRDVEGSTYTLVVELAAGDRDTRHWHVDYLLGHPEAAVRDVVRTPGVDVECAASIQDRPVRAF